MPANSVIWAFLGGLLSAVALHVAKSYGYEVPPDVADGLPAALAVLLAHYVPDRPSAPPAEKTDGHP